MYLITSVQLVNRKSNVHLNRPSLRYALLSSATVAIRVSKAIAVLWFLGLCCVSTFSLPFLELELLTTSDALLIFGLPTQLYLPFLFPFPSSTFSLSAAPTPSHPTKNFSSPVSPALTCSSLPLSPLPIPSFPLPLILPRCHPLPHFRPLHPATFSLFIFFAFGQGCRSWVDSTVFTIIMAV